MSNGVKKLESAAISSLPIFRGLPLEAVQAFGRSCIDRSFGKGEMIYFPRGEAGRVFLVLSGEVRLYRSQGGEKVIIRVLKPGEMFGDLSFVGDRLVLPSENYAQATSPAKVCVAMVGDFNKLLSQYPTLAMIMLVTLRNQLHETESKIKDLALSSAQTRIMNELLRFAANHGKENGGFYEIEDRLTHQQLAEMTGLTRETVTKTLNFLEEAGFISQTETRTLRLNRDKILKDCLDCIQLEKSM